MSKRKSDRPSDSTDEPILALRDGHQRTAIERVFRFTHGREMTMEERRGFGLPDGETKTSRRSSRNHRDGDDW